MGEGKTQRSAGWYAGACVFWLLAAWLTTVGVSSLVSQIFGPAFLNAPRGASCAEDLGDLSAELLNRAGEHVKAAPRPGTRDTLQAFLDDFDRRLMQTKRSCNETEQAAYTELFRLRHGLSALLERFDREQLPHLRKIHALLDEPTQQGAPTP